MGFPVFLWPFERNLVKLPAEDAIVQGGKWYAARANDLMVHHKTMNAHKLSDRGNRGEERGRKSQRQELWVEKEKTQRNALKVSGENRLYTEGEVLKRLSLLSRGGKTTELYFKKEWRQSSR